MLKNDSEVKSAEWYSGTKPTYVWFAGKWSACTSWNKLLPRLCELIYNCHYDCTTIDLFRAELIDLTKQNGAPKIGERFLDGYSYIKVEGLRLYVRTSLSAKRTIKQARTLIRHFGDSDSYLSFRLVE